MLNIKTIRLLSKVQGLFDKINTPEVVVKIVIDDYFVLPQIKGTTTSYETVWNEAQFPLIQLSPYQLQYKLKFAVYREGILIGTSNTLITYGKVLKQQNDVLDDNSSQSGKILYEISWEKQVTGDYITYQQFISFKQKNKASNGSLGAITVITKRQQVRTYVRNQDDDDCGCGCFGGGRKRPQPSQNSNNAPKQALIDEQKSVKNERKMKIFNKAENENIVRSKYTPFLYLQSQLQSGTQRKQNNIQRLAYYSKSHVLSK